MMSSASPPSSAAVMPRVAATAVARAAAATPSISDRRAPITTCEKTSLPWSVVPKRWCQEGAWRVARMLKSSGCATEIHGAISATTVTEATIKNPRRDFGLASRSANQPGM